MKSIVVWFLKRIVLPIVSWSINLLAKEHPRFLGDLIGSMDAEPMANAVNTAMAQHGETVTQLASAIDAGPLGKIVNGLIAQNPAMVTELVAELDPATLAKAVNAFLEKEPAFVADLVAGIELGDAAKLTNTILNRNPDLMKQFMSDFDVKVVAEGIDRGGNELLTFVNALLDEKHLFGQIAFFHQSNLGKKLNKTHVGASTRAVHIYKLDYDYKNMIEHLEEKIS